MRSGDIHEIAVLEFCTNWRRQREMLQSRYNILGSGIQQHQHIVPRETGAVTEHVGEGNLRGIKRVAECEFREEGVDWCIPLDVRVVVVVDEQREGSGRVCLCGAPCEEERVGGDGGGCGDVG